MSRNWKMIEKQIKVGFELDIWERYGIRQAIRINVAKYPHWLLCGNSGSGKSYLTQYLIRNLLEEYQDGLELFIADFKNSDDYGFAQEYSRFYTGEKCVKAIEQYYREYQAVKAGALCDNRLRLLIFDEWAGFQLWETQENKKLAEKHKSHLTEILLQGRSMHTAVWIICQRPDSKFIEGREQFFVTVALGKMSREMKQMVMQGEELEQRTIYMSGEGIIRTDSIGTKFLKVPKIRNPERLREQIKGYLLQADAANGGMGLQTRRVSITPPGGTEKS